MLLNHQREYYLTKARGLFAGIALFLIFPIFGTVNAQYTYDPTNFYGAAPQPTGETCDSCVGEVFIKMTVPEVVMDDGVANIKVDFLATAKFSSAFQARLDSEEITPYLGDMVFQVSVGGPGINLDAGACKAVDGNGKEMDPNTRTYAFGDGEGELAPPSLELQGLSPGVVTGTDPSLATHYVLSSEPVTVGTLMCPRVNLMGVYAYVLNPSVITDFTVQLSAADALPLILRAGNSFEYYPLNGDDPFEFAGTVTGGGTGASLVITNNLPGVDRVITAGFTAIDLEDPTAGCSVDPGEPVVDGNQVTVTFSESQADNDCTVTFIVTLPDGSSYSYDQVVGTSGTPQERLVRDTDAYVNNSLVSYERYFASQDDSGTISRPDGGAVALGAFVKDTLEVQVAGITVDDNNVRSREVPATLDGPGVQALLNATVSVASSADAPVGVGTVTTPLTNVYSFSGMVTDATDSSLSFVINLANDSMVGDSGQLETTIRMVKQLYGGNWRGANDGSAGSVSYLVKYEGTQDVCTGDMLDWQDSASDGSIPASPTTPVSCIRITIVDDGMYDTDGRGEGEAMLGTISDPIVGVMNSPDIKLAHDSSPGGGGGGNGFLGIGSAGAWTIMALLTVLGLSMLRRRRVTVRNEL